MSDMFEAAFKQLIGHEGGFTLHRSDPGNWTGGKVGVGRLKGTKFGVSAASYPTLDIQSLTLTEAQAIYRRDFWNKVRGDEIAAYAETLPDPFGWYDVLFDLFDTAVNSGPRRAVMLLQDALNVPSDGAFGPQTWGALTGQKPTSVSARFNGHRLKFMADLPIWPTFGRGWARRIAANLIDTQ